MRTVKMPDNILELLGTLPDEALADYCNCSRDVITKMRKKRKIVPHRKHNYEIPTIIWNGKIVQSLKNLPEEPDQIVESDQKTLLAKQLPDQIVQSEQSDQINSTDAINQIVQTALRGMGEIVQSALKSIEQTQKEH